MQAVMRTTLSNTQVLLKAIVTTDFKEIDRVRCVEPHDVVMRAEYAAPTASILRRCATCSDLRRRSGASLFLWPRWWSLIGAGFVLNNSAEVPGDNRIRSQFNLLSVTGLGSCTRRSP